MGKTISFRLRAIDSDISAAIVGMSSEDVTEACRNGLRLMLGITTTKTVQTVEKAIVIPKQPAAAPTRQIIGNQTAAPYRPKS